VVVFGGKVAAHCPVADLWLLQLPRDGTAATWRLLSATGQCPSPRASHAAATLAGAMYLYGGKAGYGQISDELYRLQLSWQRDATANLGDYSYTASWSKLSGGSGAGGVCGGGANGPATSSRPMPTAAAGGQGQGSPLPGPPARFSHSLTAATGQLVLCGGCPAVDHSQLYVFDTAKGSWSTCPVAAPVDLVPVRHVAAHLAGKLLLVGGGAFCFSFGTVFGEPHWLPWPGGGGQLGGEGGGSNVGSGAVVPGGRAAAGTSSSSRQQSAPAASGTGTSAAAAPAPPQLAAQSAPSAPAAQVSQGPAPPGLGWALLLPTSSAKQAKDALKAAGWLDTSSMAQVLQEQHPPVVALPLTAAAAPALQQPAPAPVAGASKQTQQQAAAHALLAPLLASGAARLTQLQLSCSGRSAAKPPAAALREAMVKLLEARGVPAQRAQQLLTQLPRRWEKLGDLALIPADAMTDGEWQQGGEEVWRAVAAALKVQRLARQRPVASNGEWHECGMLFGSACFAALAAWWLRGGCVVAAEHASLLTPALSLLPRLPQAPATARLSCCWALTAG
jgi:hypothetical protein